LKRVVQRQRHRRMDAEHRDDDRAAEAYCRHRQREPSLAAERVAQRQ
jgi:hypothetical protein